MKRIEAIIRKTRFEDVKEALLQSDINWFEYHDVHGIGQSRQRRADGFRRPQPEPGSQRGVFYGHCAGVGRGLQEPQRPQRPRRRRRARTGLLTESERAEFAKI